jgi:hypothetical protein
MRFGLRTLLICMTLVAVFVGASQSHRRRLTEQLNRLSAEGIGFSLSEYRNEPWSHWRNERWTALGDRRDPFPEDNHWADLIWLRFPRSAVITVERWDMESGFIIGEQEYERGKVVKRIEELRDQLVSMGMSKETISVDIGVTYTPEGAALGKELERAGIAAEVDYGIE